MPASLTRHGDELHLKLEGRWSEISDAKEKVKEIAGRRWDGDRKVWILPADPATADRVLKTIRPEASDELSAWLQESMMSHEESLTSPLADDSAGLKVPWGYARQPWQPEVVNDEQFDGALPYQRSAIDVMADNGRAVLADDMGLGKTFEALTAVEEWVLRSTLADQVTSPEGPRLVVAPASVVGGWRRELARWLPDPPIQIVDATNPRARHRQLQNGIRDDAWVIVNWEQLRLRKIEARTRNGGKRSVSVMKEPLFQYPQAGAWDLELDSWDYAAYAKADREFGKAEPGWLAAIADEVHRAKNRNASQTKGLWRVRGQVMYGLTGTPIMNSPDELWSILAWLWPAEYHERGAAHSPGAQPYSSFFATYVDFWEDHYGRKVITGVKNPEALRFVLRGKVIRRTAALLGLKGRKRIFYDAPLTPVQQKLYDEAEKAMWLAVEKDVAEGNKAAIEFAKRAAEGGSAFELMRIPNGAARFVRLQQIIENAALLGGSDSSAVMDDFEQKIQDSRPEPWVGFFKYKHSCDLMAERLRKRFDLKVEVYTGDVPAAHRTQIEDAFQRGEIDVLVGTIDAMYQGITLTRGHLQFWASRDVVPAKNEQGEARQDRLGQQQRVLVYIPQAPDTVATDRVHIINRLKEGIVKTVLLQDKIEEVNQ